MQLDRDQRHALELAVNTYQYYGTQAIVIDSLQDAIQEYGNDHDILSKIIIDIILRNRMCMLSLL